MNAPAQIKLTKAHIARAMAILELCPELDLDEQLKLSTLEGETDLYELVSQLLAENEDDEGFIEQIKAQIAVRRDRISRLEQRVETRRNAIISLMDCAQITKLPLPEATVSVRTLGPRAKVIDEDALPEHFCKLIRKPDMATINEAVECGQSVPGVVMSNGSASLTVRRK